MTPRELITDVLLVLGVGAELICCIGVVVMRTPFDRLHYAAAATSVGPILIAAAVLVSESVSSSGLQTIATVALLCLLNPVLEIAIARAARRITLGRLESLPEERAQ